MVAYVNLRTMEKTSRYFTEVVAVTYRSGCLRELLITDFETNQTGFNNHGCNWSRLLTRVVARRALTALKNSPMVKKFIFLFQGLYISSYIYLPCSKSSMYNIVVFE